MRLPLVQLILCAAVRLGAAAVKYNHRIFVDVPSITFADALKDGFRVVLSDEFLRRHVGPTLLPTLFVSAIPLRSGDKRITSVLYPDQLYEDRQVKISGLQERSWYYVCVEWESFNRHNETTGTTCRLFRTLDRFGKTADSTLTGVEKTLVADTFVDFLAHTAADFPIRYSVYLSGGGAGVGAAQNFYTSSPSALDIHSAHLRPNTSYDKLCFVEEPLVQAYSAMGRLVQRITQEKCFFGDVRTEPAAGKHEKRAESYRYTMAGGSGASRPPVVLSVLAFLLVHLLGR